LFFRVGAKKREVRRVLDMMITPSKLDVDVNK